MNASTHLHEEPLILIAESNRAIGTAGKLTVHAQGLLHRAFSIFLVDSGGRILMQRRQITKYHSGGLWANTCCGHPRPGERTRAAAARRLREEMQIDADLQFRFHTRYQADLGGGMHENELVYVYFAPLHGETSPNPEEASAIELLSLARLRQACAAAPASFAVWLHHYLVNHYREIALAVNAITHRATLAPPPHLSKQGIRP
jgi:isopentenyl-diphosphate delta-isomerase